MNTKEQQTINAIRILSAEAIQKAKSGHPGLPMGTAPLAYTLWANHLKHNPQNPNWVNRDRFALSAGHGSMLLYSLLHLFGYGLEIEDLKQFRQFRSKTPGHPEYGHTVGVETTTGPLGQGFANGVGMALAELYLAQKFNKPGFDVVDHYTYVLSGDGCMMEGVTSEAASLAGTLGLGKLIVFYDSNSITIEGSTDLAFKEDVAKRFAAYNWQVLQVDDGNNLDEINNAINQAKQDNERPSIIIVKTLIGFGCIEKQGKASAHGEPLGEECLLSTKKNLDWNTEESFYVPQEVRSHMESIKSGLSKYESDWNELWQKYSEEHPELAKEWNTWHESELASKLLENDDLWKFEEKPVSTRNASGDVLNRIVKLIPNIIGGSADLAPSNKTLMKEKGDFSKENRSGANLRFGVREHAMGAICNGILLHGGLRPYCATFFVFSDYMRPAIRMAAIMKIPMVYVFTHDSIGVGEDGPTHQPVEHMAALRCMPGVNVFRPADAKETTAGWITALNSSDKPTALVLTRQNLPCYNETGKDAMKGGYILSDSEKETPDLLLIASGSEVEVAYNSQKVLKEKGIDARVISIPCMEIFEEQPEEYKKSVIPESVKARIVIEAGVNMGWEKYAGDKGIIIGMDTFGASGPYKVLFPEYGFSVDNVVSKASDLINK